MFTSSTTEISNPVIKDSFNDGKNLDTTAHVPCVQRATPPKTSAKIIHEGHLRTIAALSKMSAPRR